MAMVRAGNATDLRKLYFMESFVPASTDCLVMAHGGATMPLPMFRVPATVTVHFYTAIGEAFTNSNIRRVVQRPHAEMTQGRPAVLLTIPPGGDCTDYTLSKVLGRHETGARTFNSDVHTSYGEVADWMQQAATRGGALAMWTPHIAVVRNRSRVMGGSSIKLSDLIERVRAHNGTITAFYVAACRVEFSAEGQRVTR